MYRYAMRQSVTGLGAMHNFCATYSRHQKGWLEYTERYAINEQSVTE